MKPVTVLMVRVGQEPQPETVDQDLESLYKALGCSTIQSVPIGDGYEIWCDEEGMFGNKPQNSCGIIGDYFITRSGSDGYLRSLTEKQIIEATNYWRAYRHHQHPGGEPSIITGSADELLDRVLELGQDRDATFKAAQKRRGTP